MSIFEIMEKRTWHYILPPMAYEITCSKCRGSNLEWSEFRHHIWCYDCEIDFDPKDSEHAGVFSGPIPIQAAYLLGLTFDRFNLETHQVELFNLETCDWDTLDKAAKILLEEGRNPYGNHLWSNGKKYFETALYELSEGIREHILEYFEKEEHIEL